MDNLGAYPILSVCATIGSRLPDLVIKDGQLIFVQDKRKIALDYNGKRVFYNQIEEIATEQERRSILAPISGCYYFVIDTAVLWTYQNEWIQITEPPREVVFIGTELPELGEEKTLYIDKSNKEIAVWDNDTFSYVVISEKTDAITESEINSLFAS